MEMGRESHDFNGYVKTRLLKCFLVQYSRGKFTAQFFLIFLFLNNRTKKPISSSRKITAMLNKMSSCVNKVLKLYH